MTVATLRAELAATAKERDTLRAQLAEAQKENEQLLADARDGIDAVSSPVCGWHDGDSVKDAVMRVVGFWKTDAEQVRQALLERLANPRTLDNWYAQRLKRSSRRAWLELQRAHDAETARDKAVADLREFRSAAITSSKLASEREQVLTLSLESAERELRAALDRLTACEPVIEAVRAWRECGCERGTCTHAIRLYRQELPAKVTT